MSVNEVDENLIKEVVARRSEELGGRVRPQDVSIEFMDTDAAPGCRLFHARWGAGEREGWLSGLIRDGEAPDTYTGQAMAKIFRRWLETEGALPDAKLAAKVAAYLLDPADRHRMILSEDDSAQLISRNEWRPHVRLPEVFDEAGQPGIRFWWVGPRGASEVSIKLAEGDRTQTRERFIQDIVDS